MKRYLWIALVLTSCAKSKKEAPAPGDKAAAESATAPPKQDSPPPPPPPSAEPTTTGAVGGGGRGEGSTQALEQARAGGGLGVSAETTAFEPLDDGAKAKRGPAPKGAAAAAGAGVKATVTANIGLVSLDGGKPAPVALSQALKVRVSDVQACYDKAGKPELKGTLKLAFTVAATGALGSVSIESTTLKNMAIESCVVGVIQGIKLDKPLSAKETKATATVTFE